jgi:pilus assembly protein TadC
MTPLAALASGVTALAVGLIVKQVVPPPRRLRSRVEPYLSPTLPGQAAPGRVGPIRSIFGPIVRDLANWLGRLIDGSNSSQTLIRLRRAGWYRGWPEPEMIARYRMAQLKSVAIGASLAVTIALVLNLSIPLFVLLIGLGLLIGATRTRGRVDSAIEDRRDLMKVEIYTVNQLLAMRVRAGGGVIQAVRAITERGRGEVVTELAEALRLHRSGWAAPDAFRRIAELTPEPFCSRTYRLLASAEERGADLAGALLSLSEDVRETRRESIKRSATKRRAAMLLPTIAILAPVLILFVAAPLPYLITGWQ